MSISHKYRSFDQLLEDVSIDFSTYSLEGLIEPQQLIKVATRVNYDLGLRIHRTKEVVLDIEHGKAKLPYDFAYLNYAFRCGDYEVTTQVPSGTHVETFNDVPYVPAPGEIGPCDDPSCTDVCVIKTCNGKNEYQLVQRINASQYRTYSMFIPLRILSGTYCTNECPNLGVDTVNKAEIKDGFLLTNFPSGKVYLSYQATMEDEGGNLMVLDHPYCNEYYEYALKERILENMIFAGEQVVNQLSFIQQKLRAARNNALSFVNTPDFRELQKMWSVNRKAQYHNYYNMFKSYPTL